MPILSWMRSLVRNLAAPRRVDEHLDDELESYVALVTAEKVRSGMTEPAARRAALLECGGVQQLREEVRDVRAGARVSALLQDVRIAWRGLRRAPGFTLTTTFTLALGIGAATVVLAVVDRTILRPLSYADSDALVTVLQGGTDPVAPANFLDWRRALRSFSALEAAEYWTPTLAEGDAERITALHVTPGMMAMLGVKPMLGRGYSSREVLDAPREVIISHALWQRRFGADSQVVGRLVTLDAQPFTVVGVMPPAFHFAPFWATRAELWAPLPLAGASTDRDASSLRVFGRLAPGVTRARAQAELTALASTLNAQFPGSSADMRVTSLREKAIGNVAPVLYTLLGAVAFVLLITCVNVAHMLLTRGAARQKEVALRIVLGASRGRVVGQAVIEATLLAVCGAAGGVAIAMAGIRALVMRGPADLPQLQLLAFDARVALIAVAIALFTALVLGVLPALLARQAALAASLRDGSRGTTGGRSRLRQLLIASEVAFAIVLLVGTSLMVRTYQAMRTIDPGFEPRGVMTMQLPLVKSAQPSAEQRLEWFRGTLDVARGAGADVALVNHLPLAGDEWGAPTFGGTTENATKGKGQRSIFRVVTPGYFHVMHTPILRGRDVSASDDRQHPGVVVINARLAATLWPAGDALGKRLTFDAADAPSREWLTVVGVAHDVKQSQWTAPSDAELYIPYAQAKAYLEGPTRGTSYMTLVARVQGDPARLVSRLRRYLHDADPMAPLTEVQSMDSVVAQVMVRATFVMSVLLALGAIALVLAAVGIHGIMSYSVAQRRQEIGIRMALGAGAGQVVRAVVRQALSVAGVGAVAGLVMSLALSRFLQSQLYGVSPADIVSYVAAAGVLGVAVLVATAVPARRAALVDPMTAMRSE
ncbi:MAG: permease [Gemmatimonadetes bacterium]|nr:permease [Gemmatimonadota bacterium]